MTEILQCLWPTAAILVSEYQVLSSVVVGLSIFSWIDVYTFVTILCVDF